ncbi:hypothetical protein ACYT89_08470 [Ralstonia solanacearum]|uniref:hypothetical protein n=1 Tax=Ralstonia solanacearum TaxID=305 RepID=UPI0018D15B39|nr:hypothetical protein [Ralstonia solanacearum]
MKNTPQEKALRTANNISEPMLTVDDFKAWQRANGAAIHEARDALRTHAAEKALRWMKSAVSFGLTVQDAGDRYFRDCVRPKYWPAVYTEVARELFRDLGWVDRGGRNDRAP